MARVVMITLILGVLCSHSNPVAASESLYLDMTYNLNEDTLIWPGAAYGFSFDVVFRNHSDDGQYFETNTFRMPEHCGTHMDSPAHMVQGQRRTHAVPLDNLIAPAIKVDIKAKADQDRDALLEVADLEAWEEANGRIEDDVILLVYSGWGSRYPDKLTYLGTDTDDASLLHFPGIDPDAAQWLVDNRKIKAVGIDTASIDYGPSTDFRAHRVLFAQNIPGFENVANLDQLPVKGATVFAIPLKIEEGSGSPIRMFATGWRSDVPNPCGLSKGWQILPVAGIIMMMALSTIYISVHF